MADNLGYSEKTIGVDQTFLRRQALDSIKTTFTIYLAGENVDNNYHV